MKIVSVLVFCMLAYVSSAPEKDNAKYFKILGFDDFRGERCSRERACAPSLHCCSSDDRFCCPNGMFCINTNMVMICSYDPKYSSGSKGILAKRSYIINNPDSYENDDTLDVLNNGIDS